MSDSQEQEVGHSTKAADFLNLWAAAFLGCIDSADLNAVLERCVEDWLSKATKPGDKVILPSRPIPPNRPTEPNRPNETIGPPTERRRNQTRQIQRRKLKSKSRSTEATRLIKLFSVYPKRAVREIIGEKLLPYTGSAVDAERFLKATYELKKQKKHLSSRLSLAEFMVS